MKALILGGYGAVGRHLVTELHEYGDVAVQAGRDATRAQAVVDLREPDLRSYRLALSDVDVVINASGLEDPKIALLAAESGAAFVDVTATSSYIASLGRLDLPRPVIVDVGLAPGLANLLAAAVHETTGGPIDLAVVLGAGEQHGAAATAWSYRLLGSRFDDRGQSVRNYTRPRQFNLPMYGRRRLYRANFSDQHSLSRDLEVPVRTYFGLDSRLATTALAVLTWVPAASKAPRGVNLPGTDRWLVLARGHDGTTRWATGRNQSRATAMIAAITARAAVGLPPGVHHLHKVLDLIDIPTGKGISVNDAEHPVVPTDLDQ
ncbi:hypothetical protein KIPE111705_05370 [Kibdelosporangium persicum]|uniref:Saccharopine dehydrogenase n=2 Tax=Kibdelosporangium persicum TaxID=2698649 RepID=A0ABX2FCU9_9PSEU|nr:Saccharopine dehydrogenase [Kibdelosporangium persicum]